MGDLILPGAAPAARRMAIYGPRGDLLRCGEVHHPIRAMVMRLDSNGRPVGPSVEADIHTMVTWRTADPGPCVPIDLAGPRVQTLELEMTFHG